MWGEGKGDRKQDRVGVVVQSQQRLGQPKREL
jgi:hypothetical protein